MGFGEFLDHWWNLPFLVMLGLVVVFFGLQVIGIASHGGDADVDADADADVDADADADHDADADADHDADSVGMHDVLAFFGVGRVPFMVVWVVLFLFAGVFGLFFNSFFFMHAGGALPPWGFPASLGLSLAIALVAVRLFSRMAGKLVDVGGKGSTTKNDLAGKIGVVASAKLDARFGEVRVRDDRGNEIMVHARMDPRDAELVRGDEVILVEYDAGSELFTATAGGKRVMVESEGEGEATADEARASERGKQDRSRK